MKWILVALGGLAIVALGTGAMEVRLTTIARSPAPNQARQVSVEPAGATLQPVPAETQLNGFEPASEAPMATPRAPGPAQVIPGPGAIKPGCGAVSAGGKPLPLCPPG